MQKWSELKYWQSGEWQVVEEHLNDLDKAKIPYCPGKKNLFKALELVPLDKVKVVLLGQDPYPDPEYATGLAFSVLSTSKVPPSLSTILKEYSNDLCLDQPKNGDLTPWCKQGVLLWNVFPSCEVGKSLSHNWDEWTYLTKEIFEVLNENNTYVAAALGNSAAGYLRFCSKNTPTLTTSHPSPRGQLNARVPFAGCRLFSSINTLLGEIGQTPVDWRLDGQHTGNTKAKEEVLR